MGGRLRIPRRWRARVAACVITAVAASGAGVGLHSAGANTPVTGAAFTTVNTGVDGTGHCKNGNPAVNCNIYDGKPFVWLNGGPSVAYVGDGSYFFAVLVPGAQADPNDGASGNLSSPNDAYTARSFSVANGVVSYGGAHDFDSNKIRLMPYNNTTNPGGVYILAICSLADGYPVNASDCKYDAFKVQSGEPANGVPLTVTKDANGSYKDAYTWSLKKEVDKTFVRQNGGTVTFNYTVTVSHDGGTISHVKVTGTIDVTNPNQDDQSNILPVAIDGVTDQLSDGTVCTVTDGGPQTLTEVKTSFAYACDLTDVPEGQLDNTATVSWSSQFLDNGAFLDGDSANFTFKNISFAATNIDNCVSVSDTNSAGPQNALVCVGDPNPKAFTYPVTINVPVNTCTTYDNTASTVTNTTGTTGSASQTVKVCGPVAGGLTMGFWQNNNGQKIIKDGAATAGVCNTATWLRQYAPFQDLGANSSCSQVATYVYNVVKAANASGAAMNAMLKAQMLATALDVYFSAPSLGGNKIGAPAPIGTVKVDLTSVNAPPNSASYLDARLAFNNVTCETVGAALTYAASQSNAGGSAWYAQVKSTQELAKDAFDAINNRVAFSCV